MGSGFRVTGFQGLGLHGFRVWGFRVVGFSGLGFRASGLGCRPMINSPLPFKGLNTRILIMSRRKGRGVLNQGSGLGFSGLGCRVYCHY